MPASRRISERVKKLPEKYIPEEVEERTKVKKKSDKLKKKDKQKKKSQSSSFDGIDMVIRNSSSGSSSQTGRLILKELPRYKLNKTIKKQTAQKKKSNKKNTDKKGYNWAKKVWEEKKTREKRRHIYDIINDPIKYKDHIKKNIEFNIKIIGYKPNINDNFTLKQLISGTVLNNKCDSNCKDNIKQLAVGILANDEGEIDLTNETILNNFVDIVYNIITRN